MRDERFLAVASLVQAIHAAGVDASRWPGVLACLRNDLGASVVTIGRHEFDTGADTALYESPDDMQFSREAAAFTTCNPWYLSSRDYAVGRVMTGDDQLGTFDLKRTDFYRGFLQPRGLLHRLCGVVAQRGSAAYLLTAYRREERGAFDSADRAAVRALLAHITLSLEAQWRWQEADDLVHALLALADHDDHPMILVAAQAEMIHRNPAAASLLERCNGLSLDGDRVVASSLGDRRALREAVAQATRCGSADGGPEGPPPAPCAVVALAGATAQRPVMAVVRAVGPVFASSAGRRRGLALITVRGGPTAHNPATCALARAYRLSAAQARVGALVCAGQPLAAIAQALQVSENTVRSHLRLVFQKTGTHGQMDLVHLHARLCASIP